MWMVLINIWDSDDSGREFGKGSKWFWSYEVVEEFKVIKCRLVMMLYDLLE